jgi:SAM-dependent methyltransferase
MVIVSMVIKTEVVMSETTREQVRERYAKAAVGGGCCSSDCGDSSLQVDASGGLYTASELASVPVAAGEISLGCGNPTAVAELALGETVLDLGSGGGIDVLLAARRVGDSGYVYGLDMTDEMLELARSNAREAQVTNVEFLRGYIEEIPLRDQQIDVAISNCVINLSTDKSAVFRELYRILKPGGRIGISDIVAQDSLSAEDRAERGSWVGCIAGALSYEEYRQELAAAGFVDISLRTSHAVIEGMDSVLIRAKKRAEGREER